MLTLTRRERPYVLVARSISAAGVASAVERIAFTADNVIAQATITSPFPSHQGPVITPTSFTATWTGADPEAPNGVPTGYWLRLVTANEVNPANPLGITQEILQGFLENDLATNRTAWIETADLRRTLSNLSPQTLYYFAVAAKDAGGGPGAVESTFSPDRNVLQFWPSLSQFGPDMIVFNSFFYFRKRTVSLDPTPWITVPLRAGEAMDVNWSGQPDRGTSLDGFRWALDIADVTDETPRRNANDLEHWSAWSLTTISTTVGPFPPADAKKDGHRLYIEARDSFDRRNLFVVGIDTWHKPTRSADLLLVDDMYGTPTERTPDGAIPYKGAYPMEAEQDSFYNAVGGFPDSLRILGTPSQPGGGPGALSEPGAFAGFDYDTLDYRLWPEESISVLNRYRAVAWYTNQQSAARDGSKFGSTTPRTALRAMNRAQALNSLSVYVAGGGKLWLFGDGATTAIANGYWSRIAFSGAPRVPYTSGDDPRVDILIPGDFLYDFCHLRSQLSTAGTFQTALTQDQQLQYATPFLPEFVGSRAERSAQRWNGLPRLTLSAFRGASPDPATRSVNLTWVISAPLSIVEGTGRNSYSVLDTLYLCGARRPDPDHVLVPPSDGFPNAVDYHGSEHGEVVWFGFPLYYFERSQARQVVATVMRAFGIAPLPAGVRQGPGAAEPPVGDGATAFETTRALRP